MVFVTAAMGQLKFQYLQSMQYYQILLIAVLTCAVPASDAQCSSLVVNGFLPNETTTLNALGELSGDDGTTQGVSIVNGRLIIQTKPNIAGGWYTDINSGCRNVSSQNFDQIEVIWSNSSPSDLVLSVLWGADDNACQTRTWTTTSAGADSGVIGDSSKTTTFQLTPQMTARIHAIYLGFPAQESSTTYSIRSIRMAQTSNCVVAAAKSAKATNTALSLSLAFVLVLVTFTFTSLVFIN